jgi:hypothetical protein
MDGLQFDQDELRRDELELAGAILAGARLRPQSFGSYFSQDGRSCALGAAYEGMYVLPHDIGSTMPLRLERLFHCLEYIVRPCPAGCRKRLPLAPLIVHLNDDHEWTREQIADWIGRDARGAAPTARTGQGPS